MNITLCSRHKLVYEHWSHCSQWKVLYNNSTGSLKHKCILPDNLNSLLFRTGWTSQRRSPSCPAKSNIFLKIQSSRSISLTHFSVECSLTPLPWISRARSMTWIQTPPTERSNWSNASNLHAENAEIPEARRDWPKGPPVSLHKYDIPLTWTPIWPVTACAAYGQISSKRKLVNGTLTGEKIVVGPGKPSTPKCYTNGYTSVCTVNVVSLCAKHCMWCY